MSSAPALRQRVKHLLDEETGTLYREAAQPVALLYPSPYRVGMSSLGYQAIYRILHEHPGRSAARAFLPDSVSEYREARLPLFTFEEGRPISDYPVIAVSVAYEAEIAGLIECLELSGIPPLAKDRDERHPFVLAGGPLTFSNPVPLGPFVDAILMGEAEDTIHPALDRIFAGGGRQATLRELAEQMPSCYVPSLHGEMLCPLGKTDNIPAFAQITTPNTELRNMFLIEGERGCSRGCRYCVMRRSTNGGMRIVPMEKVLSLIPDHAKKVGLVGAAISDHPKIAEIVGALADQGRQVGLSSLRPDKIREPFVSELRRAGHKTLTTAMDGASERMRELVDRRARIKHLRNAAEMARKHKFDRLKLYLILGLPTETDEDVDELIGFSTELSKRIPLSLGIAPFVSKRNTPLDNQPFAGIKVVDKRLSRLRKGVKGRVDIRGTSARWAWVEYVLAQGGFAEGLAVLDAVHAGGQFRAYKQAFEALPKKRRLPNLGIG